MHATRHWITAARAACMSLLLCTAGTHATTEPAAAPARAASAAAVATPGSGPAAAHAPQAAAAPKGSTRRPAAAVQVRADARGTAPAAKPAPYTADELAAHERARQSRLGIGPLHKAKKGGWGDDCASCHGERIMLTDNMTRENVECIDCHGDYADMADKSAEKIKNKQLNAHASHLGPEIACAVCHSAHREPKAYCVNCHTNFVMPVPGSTPQVKR